MVCDKCEKKLGSVACPDKWKDGASNTIKSGKVKLNENKLLGKKGGRFTPYAASKCTVCKTNLFKPDHTFCHTCAYQRGVCEMCGKQILDVKKYKQSTV